MGLHHELASVMATCKRKAATGTKKIMSFFVLPPGKSPTVEETMQFGSLLKDQNLISLILSKLIPWSRDV